MKNQDNKVLSPFEFFLLDEINRIREYVDDVESFITKEFEKKAFKLVKNIDSASPEQKQMLESHHEHLVWKFTTIFPRILRYSIFLTCYSFLEAKFTELCRHLEANYKLKLTDLSGKGVIRAHNYLSKVIQIPKIKEILWNRIIFYNRIRNKIAHCQGELTNDNDSKAIVEYSNTLANIRTMDTQIDLLETFIPEVLSDIEILFQELKAELGIKFP